MKRNRLSRGVRLALGMGLLGASSIGLAQEVADSSSADSEDKVPRKLEEVVVQADITYRDRSEDIAPTLVYDLEYFQRFEPNTVGDMVKRVPGVGFVGSDIGEYDGAQMRGLGGGYTQVLINGKKVPGAGDDRSFWVDRIPAEMVDRIEILRSNSANRSGDAVAGAINIVLRDAYEFDGSYVRIGVNRWHDGEINPTFGAVTSTEALGGRVLVGVNVQDRYRSKFKRSDRFEEYPPSDANQVSWEDQDEVKDGRDYSANVSYTADVSDSARFKLDAFYVKTDRDVTEVSFEEELDDDEVVNARVPGLNPVDQRNWGIGAELDFDMAGGETEIDLDHARFEDSSSVTEEEHKYISDASQWNDSWSIDGAEWDESTAEAEAVDATDGETSLKVAHKRDVGGIEMEFGIDYRYKKRDVTYTFWEWEAEDEGDPVVYELDKRIGSVIRETRIDPYIMFTGQGERLGWEAGLRYETTDSEVATNEDGETLQTASNDYGELLPSLHLRYDLDDASRINFSLARSIKRANFNELIPALLDGEFGDNDYIGNPRLDPETAIGFDLGYEHRLGSRGVVGVNLFYRKVKSLIELVNTGIPSEDAVDNFIDDYVDDALDAFEDANPDASDDDLDDAEDAFNDEAEDLVDAILASGNVDALDADSWLFTSANVGDGSVYGVEFDLSTPLTVIGLDNTGVFMNYSWVDSKVDDFMGERRFNDQAKSVFNVGFIQDMPDVGVSFGASYRKQGDAYSRILAEEGITRYGDDLEAFVEKRFGKRVSLRLSAANLLDASKDEFYDKFDNLDDQLSRDYDEYELETEEAGPSYQLVLRWAF